MVLNDILNQGVQIVPNGFQCSTPDGAMKVFKFIREAVLDRHIYITKAVGVRFTNDVHSKADSDGKVHIEGYYNCGESYPELMLNFNDKVFLTDPSTEIITIPCRVGRMSIDKVMDADSILYQNPYIAQVLSNSMSIELAVRYSCGFSSMSENSKVSSDMFPFMTDYSLSEYVRVLPMLYGETLIRLKFLHGMTMVKFINILRKWNLLAEQYRIKKEELIWLQSFGR